MYGTCKKHGTLLVVCYASHMNTTRCLFSALLFSVVAGCGAVDHSDTGSHTTDPNVRTTPTETAPDIRLSWVCVLFQPSWKYTVSSELNNPGGSGDAVVTALSDTNSSTDLTAHVAAAEKAAVSGNLPSSVEVHSITFTVQSSVSGSANAPVTDEYTLTLPSTATVGSACAIPTTGYKWNMLDTSQK
jgi:hypothetical protein